LGGRVNYYSFRLVVQQEWAERQNLRLGQVYLDILDELRPDLANKLRGSLHDPFYKNEIPVEAEQLVEREWDDNTEFSDIRL